MSIKSNIKMITQKKSFDDIKEAINHQPCHNTLNSGRDQKNITKLNFIETDNMLTKQTITESSNDHDRIHLSTFKRKDERDYFDMVNYVLNEYNYNAINLVDALIYMFCKEYQKRYLVEIDDSIQKSKLFCSMNTILLNELYEVDFMNINDYLIESKMHQMIDFIRLDIIEKKHQHAFDLDYHMAIILFKARQHE